MRGEIPICRKGIWQGLDYSFLLKYFAGCIYLFNFAAKVKKTYGKIDLFL